MQVVLPAAERQRLYVQLLFEEHLEGDGAGRGGQRLQAVAHGKRAHGGQLDVLALLHTPVQVGLEGIQLLNGGALAGRVELHLRRGQRPCFLQLQRPKSASREDAVGLEEVLASAESARLSSHGSHDVSASALEALRLLSKLRTAAFLDTSRQEIEGAEAHGT